MIWQSPNVVGELNNRCLVCTQTVRSPNLNDKGLVSPPSHDVSSELLRSNYSLNGDVETVAT